ncbi:MAG TPA: rhomboid family intramembrane serine protease [Gemmataceae bacterium]|nr:rhomboid family intramembrane serine protease [Gemmataceae bacterium]
MVLPLYDDNTGRRLFPYVNYALIAINVLVFVFLQRLGPEIGGKEGERFTYAFACVPYEIVTGKDVRETVAIEDPLTKRQLGTINLPPTPISVYLTLLTSMFLHGGILHLLGNMLFLWIFGDNVEDDLGHVRYVFFYLVCGVLASLAHVASTYAFQGNPYIPSLGASGAISGVLGGYLLLHPHRRVMVILFRMLTEVPAYVAIGIWFLFQLLSGITELGGKVGGVAYGAHIGGFIAGLALVKVFALGRETTTWNRRAPTARTWY